MARIPIIREDDGEMLGCIEQSRKDWTAQTIFGYVFARSDKRDAVEEAVRSQGLIILQGLWQYFDKDDNEWYPCILKEVYENKVTVIRTTPLGYQDPDDYKIVTLADPTETVLIKA